MKISDAQRILAEKGGSREITSEDIEKFRASMSRSLISPELKMAAEEARKAFFRFEVPENALRATRDQAQVAFDNIRRMQRESVEGALSAMREDRASQINAILDNVREPHMALMRELHMSTEYARAYKKLFSTPPPTEQQKVEIIGWSRRVLTLADDPEELFKLSPRDLEHVVATLVESEGYKVQLTKQTRDGGYDIVAYSKDALSEYMMLVEVKRNRPDRPVSVGVIRSLDSVMDTEGADRGMIVTTSRFSPDAEAHPKVVRRRIALRNFDLLVEWLQVYADRLRD